MQGLLDGDIFAFRVACTTEGLPEGIARARLEDMLDVAILESGIDSYRVFLTGENNFRKQIYPEYKANRTKPKPEHLQFLREWLKTHWEAEEEEGLEADDLLGINQTENTIILSIDKDLLQVPGEHYNFVKKEFNIVSPIEGLQSFYRQLLIGDRSDNIFGISGIGPVKANKLINSISNEQAMFDKVRSWYNNDKHLLMNGRCLYIKRTIEDDWKTKYEALDGSKS